MSAKQIERAAYMAAHRILVADTIGRGLACPGARRSRAVDTIAGIITEIFELQDAAADDAADRLAATESGPHLVDRRRIGVVLELPLRASS